MPAGVTHQYTKAAISPCINKRLNTYIVQTFKLTWHSTKFDPPGNASKASPPLRPLCPVPYNTSAASAAEPSRQESHRRRSGGGSGGAGGGSGGAGDSRIVNFFRSFFRRNNNNSQRTDAAAENDSAVGGGTGGPVGGVGLRDGGGGQLAAVGAMGVEVSSGAEGLANFAVRDLINFLNPAFAAPNAAESMVSFERALAWSVGGPGAGSVGGGGNGRVRGRRRLQLPSADEAREELQLNGLMLAPHQVKRWAGVLRVVVLWCGVVHAVVSPLCSFVYAVQ